MNPIKLTGAFLLTLVLFITSCNPDDPEPMPPPEYPMQITVDHLFNGNPLLLNGDYDTTVNGDSFQLTKLIYHINNFTFYKNGSPIFEDDGYFMVDLENPESLTFELGLMDGRADSMSFYLGIADSTTNAEGLLNAMFTDPMYWGMINGYINFKLEGNSPVVDNGAVVLHVGGYTGNTKNFQKIGLDLSASEPASELGGNNVNLQMELANYFTGPNLIDLSVTNLVHSPTGDAVLIAENWADLFSFTGSN